MTRTGPGGGLLLWAFAAACWGVASPDALHGQQRVEWTTAFQAAQDQPPGRIFPAAIAGSAVGAFAGSLIGLSIASDGEGGDWNGLGGLVLGWAIGSTLGSALVADLADGPGRTLGSRLLVSALVGAVSVGAASADGGGVFLLALPLTQALVQTFY